jgi:hypothetical protein
MAYGVLVLARSVRTELTRARQALLSFVHEYQAQGVDLRPHGAVDSPACDVLFATPRVARAVTCKYLEHEGNTIPHVKNETPDDPQAGGRVLYKRAQPANSNASTVSAVVAVRCAGRGGRQTT